MCGGSNLSTVLPLWGIYIKKCISLVRIRLQTRNARNASIKFRKTSESKKAEKSLEISAFLVFSCLHLNQTLIMAGIAGFEPAKMPESKSGALPLGYIPIFSCDHYCITNSRGCQEEFSRFLRAQGNLHCFDHFASKKTFYSHKSRCQNAKNMLK